MQVIRNIYHPRRTLTEKIREAWFALRLERMHSKDEVLLQYLNRVPFGNQVLESTLPHVCIFETCHTAVGCRGAFLAAIPNSPTMNDPYRHFSPRARAAILRP